MDELKRLKSQNNTVKSTSKISRIMNGYSYVVGEQLEEDTAFEINETLHEIITFARYQLRKNGVTLKIDLPDEELFLHGRRKDFALMLLNITFNASESMNNGGARPWQSAVIQMVQWK